MAQHLGHDLGVDPGDEHQRGGRVAQVVEADGRQPLAAQQRTQAALGDARSGQRLAELIGEDQAVVGPGRPRAQPRLRCLLMDRPGFGLSSPLAYDARSFGHSVADLQRDVLDAVGVEHADVVGHSIGGVFALRLAHLHPDRIRRVVLLGAGPIVQEAGVPTTIRRIASPLGAVMVWLTRFRGVTRSMIRGSGHSAGLDDGRIPEAFIAWQTAVNRETDSMRHERQMVRAVVVGRSGYRPELTFTDEELAAITRPALMLYGTADPVGSPTIWKRVMGTIPNGSLSILDGVGHMVWLDEPRRVASEMRSFLGR